MNKINKGDVFPCLDPCGMLSIYMGFVGVARLYNSMSQSGSYNRDYSDKREYYVFEMLDDDSSYKYAACLPVFSGLNFKERFNIVRYGSDIDHMFVNFKQPRLIISSEPIVEINDEFPKKYSDSVKNSGR